LRAVICPFISLTIHTKNNEIIEIVRFLTIVEINSFYTVFL